MGLGNCGEMLAEPLCAIATPNAVRITGCDHTGCRSTSRCDNLSGYASSESTQQLSKALCQKHDSSQHNLNHYNDSVFQTTLTAVFYVQLTLDNFASFKLTAVQWQRNFQRLMQKELECSTTVCAGCVLPAKNACHPCTSTDYAR